MASVADGIWIRAGAFGSSDEEAGLIAEERGVVYARGGGSISTRRRDERPVLSSQGEYERQDMTQPTIAELFKAAAQKMRAEFQEVTRGSPHAGERGEEAEEILRTFLNGHLPKRFAAAAGHMIDVQNQISHQADVLVYDQISSTVLRTGKGLILPSENVAALIEVKSRLDKQELTDAVQKIASAKELIRPQLGSIDEPVRQTSLITTSLLGVVFAFEARTALQTLAENLRDLHDGIPSSRWTDMVVVLDEGLIGHYAQFPFDSGSLAGAFMPPTAADFKPAPLYVQLMVQPQGEFTLNRFFVFLSSHLVFFRRITENGRSRESFGGEDAKDHALGGRPKPSSNHRKRESGATAGQESGECDRRPCD